jgi:hypothetical protein
MQALTQKKIEEAKMREMLATDATRTLEERVEHVRHLHYDENQEIFAVAHSSIHKAAADGSVDGIKYFLDSHRRPRVKIDDFDKSGLCPIHCAAKAGMTQCVKYLVDTGCEPDTRSTYGDTALMHACKENKVNVIEQLFNYGIDIKLANTAGMVVRNTQNPSSPPSTACTHFPPTYRLPQIRLHVHSQRSPSGQC